MSASQFDFKWLEGGLRRSSIMCCVFSGKRWSFVVLPQIVSERLTGGVMRALAGWHACINGVMPLNIKRLSLFQKQPFEWHI